MAQMPRSHDVVNAAPPGGQNALSSPVIPHIPDLIDVPSDGQSDTLGALTAQMQSLIDGGHYANADFMYLAEDRVVMAFEDRSVAPPQGAKAAYSMVVVDENLTVIKDKSFAIDEIDPVSGIELQFSETGQVGVHISFVADAPPQDDVHDVEGLTKHHMAGTGRSEQFRADDVDTVMHGFGGDDRLRGGNGDDEMHGGRGDDNMRGAGGDDYLDGDGGDDFLRGGDGQDTLRGGAGDDTLYGQDGDDTLFGGHGADMLSGGAGNDMLNAGKGDDLLEGWHGDDSLYGKHGDDVLRGDKGNDLLHGGRGNDVLDGGKDADTLIGGRGDDTLTGGKHSDLFQFGGRFGHDTITDFTQGEDQLSFAGFDGDLSSLMITQEDDHTRIGWGKGSVLLENTDADEIDVEDFVF
ncbi:calcium-binding protein [Shimia ponticola]|uniref:calcium-binding protein n=1 Tax=Shimia ponticola TaxID=2582893 RepID=UPI001C9B5726|nr:calcium-binding protein [Shimia ponticola]